MRHNFLFWVERHNWPRAVGHVFLAEAVQQLGRVLIADWKTTDPVADPNSIPAHTIASDKGGQTAPLVLNQAREQRAARARFVQLQGAIADLVVRGQLITGTRAIEGGVIEPLRAELWQTEGRHLDARFDHCQINPAAPFVNAFAGNGWRYIFVTAESLAGFLAATGHVPGLLEFPRAVVVPNTAGVAGPPFSAPATRDGRRGRRKGDTSYSQEVPTIIREVVAEHGWPDKDFEPSWNLAALIVEVQKRCVRRKQVNKRRNPPSASTLKRYIDELRNSHNEKDHEIH